MLVLVIDHTCAFSDYEDKYSMAKEKLSELAEAVEETNKQKAEVEEKYSLSKEAIRNLQADLKQAQVGGALKQKNEALQRELNAARNELRSLKVQNMAADTKIRMLQSEQHKSEVRLFYFLINLMSINQLRQIVHNLSTNCHLYHSLARPQEPLNGT